MILIILCLLSILNIQAINNGDVNISLVMISVIVIPFLLIWKIYNKDRLLNFIKNNKSEIAFYILYNIICLISLVYNLPRYDDNELVAYGLTPIILTAIFPLTITLFYFVKHCNKKNINRDIKFASAIFAILAIVGIWQRIDYQSAAVLTQFFVSSEVTNEVTSGVVTSLTRWHTDFGSLMALICIAFISIMFRQGIQSSKIILLVLILCFIGGMASEARIFALTFFVGVFVMCCYYARAYAKQVLLIFICGFVIIHAVLLNNKGLAEDYGKVLPYVHYMSENEELSSNDFSVVINNNSLSNRGELWVKAINLWQDSQWIGVSSGGFRLSAASDSLQVHNTHNLVLQVLIDSGIIGFILFVAFSAHVIFKYRERLPILIALIACLQFDYFIDHSLVWIIISSWLLVYGEMFNIGNKKSIVSQQPTKNHLFIFEVVSLIIFCISVVYIGMAVVKYRTQLELTRVLQTEVRIASMSKFIPWYEKIYIDARLLQSAKNNIAFHNPDRVIVFNSVIPDCTTPKNEHFFVVTPEYLSSADTKKLFFVNKNNVDEFWYLTKQRECKI